MIRSAYGTLLFATLSISTLGACAADSGTDVSATGGGKADGSAPTIKFAADWSESASGDLLAGSPVRISYDLARLPDCHGSSNGSEVWGAGGFASFDGAAPVSFEISRLVSGVVKPVSPELEVPASATSVEFWFSSSNIWGCNAYDSNNGANYKFAIHRSASGAVLSFDADWTESQSDALHAGDAVVVHYDPSRLQQCAASSGGHAGWGITAHYTVDGGAEKTLMVSRADGSTLVAGDPTFTVPRGHDIAMWFSASSVYGCNAYDSNMNANYHFAIE